MGEKKKNDDDSVAKKKIIELHQVENREIGRTSPQKVQVAVNEDSQKLYDSYQFSREQNIADDKCDIDEDNMSYHTKKQKVEFKLLDIIKRLKLRMAASKLINSTRSRMLKKMTNLQYSFINDKAQDFSDFELDKKVLNTNQRPKYVINKGVQIFINMFAKVIEFIPVINPSVLLKSLWDLCISLVLLYSFYIIPVMVSFGLEEDMVSQSYSIEVIIVLNIIDILIQCNTGFYKHGILCKDRQMIWRRYYDEQLKTDGLSLLPLVLFKFINQFALQSKFYQFVTLTILLKCKTIVKNYANIQQNYILKPEIRNILKLLNLFFKIFLIAHVCACAWIVTGRISKTMYGTNWMQYKDIQEQQWETKYLWAFYFCTVTMATVGYGDITPQTPLETMVTIVMVLFACGVFGFSVNTISDILKDFFKKENEIMEKMCIIKNYLEKKSINQYLSRDVTEYLEYVWRSDQNSFLKEEQQIIQSLPDSLRGDLLVESNKIILKECPLFQSNFSEDLIKSLVPIIQERNYTPEEIIYSMNDENPEKSIYFIQQGDVDIFTENNITCNFAEPQPRLSITINNQTKQKQQKIKSLKKGDYFGEIEFFTDQPRQKNAKSASFTTILKIDRSKFIAVLQQYPLDYQQFCLIKDRIIFNDDYSKIFATCQSCKSDSHQLTHCPYLHFIPNKPKIIAQSNRSQEQLRDGIGRENKILRSRKQFHVFNTLRAYNIETFLDLNEYYLDEYYQKYLNFGISRCDICIFFQDARFQNKMKHSTGMNNILNKEMSLGQNINQIFNRYNSYLNEFLSNQQRTLLDEHYLTAIPYSQRVIAEEGNQNKFRSFMKNSILLNSSEVPSDIIDISPSPQKNSKKKVLFHGYDLENAFNQQNSGCSPRINQLGSTNYINQNGALVFSDFEQEPSQKQYGQQNQYPLGNLGHQNYSNSAAGYETNQKKILRNFSNIDISEEYLHEQQIRLDLFNGNFERMKSYEFYYPLSNYEYIIKQLSMNQHQKKKMRKKLLELSRRKITQLTMKKKSQRKLNASNKSEATQILMEKQLENEFSCYNHRGANQMNQSQNSINNFHSVSQFFQQNTQSKINQRRKSRRQQSENESSMDNKFEDNEGNIMASIQSKKIEKINGNRSKILDTQDSFSVKKIINNSKQNENILYLSRQNSSNKIDFTSDGSNISKKGAYPSFMDNRVGRQIQQEDMTNSLKTIQNTQINIPHIFEKPTLNFSLYNSQIEDFSIV